MKVHEIKKVGVVGAGTMGAAIAQHFLMKGLQVVLCDVSEVGLSRGRSLIEKSLDEAVGRRLIRSESKADLLKNLDNSTALQQLASCQLIIEAVFEDLKVKSDLFFQIERVVSKEAILATNTSSFSVTDLAQSLKNRDRFIGIHYFYHAAKNKLVEIIPGEKTNSQIVQTVRDFYSYYDKLPIVVKDAAGFAVNRFFVPWLNEAVRLYEEGMGSSEEIDQVACETFQIGMGPFALMNATGVPIAYHAAEGLAEKFGPFYKAAQLLKNQKGPWDLKMKSKGALNKEVVAKRLLAASLGVAAQMVSEGVTGTTECDLGARVGLRWSQGPFEMIQNLGLKKCQQIVADLFSKWDLSMPKVLEENRIQIEWVKSYKKGHCGFIEINRPDSMNALNEAIMKEIHHAFERLDQDETIKKIFFLGSGKAFIAGADIKFFVDNINHKTFDKIYDFTKYGQKVLSLIASSKKTTVAYINGLALGGGLELALACHYRVATNKALMAFPETGIGIYPGLGGTQRAPRLIGKGLAKFLISTGQMIKAEQALGYGLVDSVIDRVVEISELDQVELKRSQRKSFEEESFKNFKGETPFTEYAKYEKILSTKAPIALKIAMNLIDEGEKFEINEAISLELRDLKKIFSTQDAKSGLESVLKREKTQYVGA